MIGGGSYEGNVFRSFAFDEMSNGQTHGIRKTWHRALRACVTNEDSTKRINSITGEISFPDGGGSAITQIELHDDDDLVIAGASYSIVGNEFSISGFTVPASDHCFVYVLLANDPDGIVVRLELEAAFVP